MRRPSPSSLCSAGKEGKELGALSIVVSGGYKDDDGGWQEGKGGEGGGAQGGLLLWGAGLGRDWHGCWKEQRHACASAACLLVSAAR